MIVDHSVLQQSCLMKRKHTAGCRQHRGGENSVSGDQIACSKIMLLNEVVESVKSRGPKTDPWGTPNLRLALEDKRSPSLILRRLPVKYDLNQSSAFPVTAKQSSNIFKGMVSSMVSKAAERSSNVSAVTLLTSIDLRMSLWIFSRAVSVEWNFLFTDWYWLDVFELFICEFSWFTTTFSRILERNSRLDTGR